MKPIILKGKGGKGGGGSVRLPREDANTLQSRAYARVVDLLCEGPIEGFCTEDGITCKDAEFKIITKANAANTITSHIAIVDGAITFDPANYLREADDAITTYRIGGGVYEPIVSDSAGYPYSASGILRCIVEGDGAGADIAVVMYPRDTDEQAETSRTISYTAHGFSVGNLVVRVGSTWIKGDRNSRGEVRRITSVPDEDTFIASLDIFPDGKVRGIKVLDGGHDYTWCNIIMPSAILQAVLFDDVPLADPATLEPNFTDVRFEYRYGTEDQTAMEGFQQVEEVFDDGGRSEIEFDDPEDWTIEDKDYDRLIVDIQMPQGYYIQNTRNGDIEAVGSTALLDIDNYEQFIGTAADYTVRVQIEQSYKEDWQNDEFYSNWLPFGDGVYTLAGKTMSAYVKSIEAYLFRPDVSKRYTWRLRVSRLTYDDDDTRRQLSPDRRPVTPIRVSQITGITNVRLTYPFCSTSGIEINAEQFGSLPVRAYRLKLAKVQVPTNYFPPYTIREIPQLDGSVTRELRTVGEYNRDKTTGLPVFGPDNSLIEQAWDGSFYEAWTNNPAWIAYEVCVNERTGLGKQLRQTDKWWHYKIARYNDQLVSTGYQEGGGFGAKEPRHTAGVFIQAREEAHKVLADLASIFSGYYYFSGGTAVPVQERPRLPRMAFTPADVQDGLFEYSGSQRRVRHTIAQIKFSDPLNSYKLSPVGYEDQDGILRYGVNTIEKTAFGTISRGQARRFGKKLILMETNNTDTVSFVTGIKGSVIRSGDVIEIYDPVRSTLPFGGKIVSTTNRDADGRQVIVLDRWFDLEDDIAASAFSMVCAKPTAALPTQDVTSSEEIERILTAQIESRRVYSFGKDAYGRRIVTLAAPFSSEVTNGATWGIKYSEAQPQLFSVVAVEEVEKHKFAITGLEYHDALFAAVDADVPYSEDPIVPDPNSWKKVFPVEGLNLTHSSKKEQEVTVYTLYVSWSKPSQGFALEYEVWLQRGLGNYTFVTTTKNTHIDFRVDGPNNYCVKVIAIGLQSRRSAPVEACTLITSLTGEGSDIISGLELKNKGNVTTFDTADAEFEWRVNWSGATSELQTENPPVLPPGISKYLIKIYDDEETEVGEFSTTESYFNLTLDRNRNLTNGPHRDFIFEVHAVTDVGAISAAAKIRVTNPLIELPEEDEYSLVADEDGNAVLRLLSSDTRPPDWAGIRVWTSTSSGFSPTDSIMLEFNSTMAKIPLSVGQTNYIRWAQFDLLSADSSDCIISDEIAITPYKQSRLSVFDFTQ